MPQENNKSSLLDCRIRQITIAEKQFNYSEYYKKIPIVNLHGRNVFLFDNLIPADKDFEISQQDRFYPVPTHIHTHIELNWMYSGTCTEIINGQEVTLNSGDLCIIDKHVPHSIKKPNENDILINILFRPSFFSTQVIDSVRDSRASLLHNFFLNIISSDTSHGQYVIFPISEKSEIKDIMKKILYEFYFSSIGSSEIIKNYIYNLFIYLLREKNYSTNLEKSKVQPTSVQKKLQLLDYIENNYKTCTLSDVAEKFGYSDQYISSFIKNLTGSSFSSLLKQFKMKSACKYLVTTQEPIEQVIKDCGFTNSSYFYREFRKQFALSPAQYREKYQ